jgi:hypothetical protein
MYEWFNQGAWAKCFALIDPRLREQGRVEQQVHAGSLRRFKEVYGKIEPWYIRLSLHFEAPDHKYGERPFANVYVVWRDEAHAFHMFREQWVQDSGRWFTRVAGLVPNENEAAGTRD